MRERGLIIREWAPDLGGFFGRHRSTWILSLGGAVLLAGVDAFGNAGVVGPVVLYGYWVGTMLFGGVVTALEFELPGGSC